MHEQTVSHCTVWEWEDENGVWNSYPSAVCRTLDSSFSTDPTCDVNISAVGRSYTIHLANMEQENDETGIVRRVRKKGGVAVSHGNGVSKKSGSEKSGASAAKKRKMKKEVEEDEEDAAEGKGVSLVELFEAGVSGRIVDCKCVSFLRQ